MYMNLRLSSQVCCNQNDIVDVQSSHDVRIDIDISSTAGTRWDASRVHD